MTRRQRTSTPAEDQLPSASSGATDSTESSPVTLETTSEPAPPVPESTLAPGDGSQAAADDSEMPLGEITPAPQLGETIAALTFNELFAAIDGYSLGQRPWDDIVAAADALKMQMGIHTSS